MGKIITIGGGGNGRPGTKYETMEIDREIVRLTGKSSPNFLMIALATKDPELYYRTMVPIFQDGLGCTMDQITLSDLRSFDILKEKIRKADIIYVGGGNTLTLMNRLRHYHIDTLLREAYTQNKMMCGISAGAICWCDYGNSFARNYGVWESRAVRVKGLGYLPILLCPHYDVDPSRKPSLRDMMASTRTIPALALDDGAALEVIDDKFRIITSLDGAKATKCYWMDREYHEQVIQKNRFYPLEELFVTTDC